MSEEIRDYYDDFSQHYDHGRDRGYHAMVDAIEVGAVIDVSRGKSVLEVGCGTGLLLEKVAREAAQATGVDLSPGMLHHARARGLDVHEGNATALPFEDAQFDVAYSFKVLAHVPEIERAVSELFRVVKPGGHVLIEVYNRASLRFISRWLGGARRIGQRHRENEVPTRWEHVSEAIARLPKDARVERLVGARVLTPMAGVYRLPFAEQLWTPLEMRLAGSRLARFGGFVIIVARKAPEGDRDARS